MKVLMKNIEMIAWFKKDGSPIPLRFRFLGQDKSNIIITINKVLFNEEEKLAGNRMIVYRCESVIDNIEKIFEIKYEINTCKWYLYKM